MTDKLLREYWMGWLRSKNMKNQGYWRMWENTAIDQEERGYELVIFKIPKVQSGGADPGAIHDIEKLLQEKFGK